MRKILLFLSLFVCFQLKGQVKPWCNNNIPIILEPYHANYYNIDSVLNDKRITSIIHKSSQGNRIDPKYFERREEAKKKGLLWGCFHLAVNANAIEQARFFLKNIAPGNDELVALDVEEAAPGTPYYFPTDSVKKFIRFVYDSIGRYPLIYCGKSKLKEISTRYPNDTLLKKCLLWVVSKNRESPDVILSQPRYRTIWKKYTLWQFSSEINCKQGWGKCNCLTPAQKDCCLYSNPGWDPNIDINVYNGNLEELRKLWPLNPKQN